MGFQSAKTAQMLVKGINCICSALNRKIRLMEVCGTHTVAIFNAGLRSLLPSNIKLLSGPGCPVCVTSEADVDWAISIAKSPDVIFMTFGDMMRVPGRESTLMEEKARGSDIRVIYSPLDCLKTAKENPSKRVVFFATGFETTAPSVAATVIEAKRQKIDNFYIYSVHKTVPPALRALACDEKFNIDGLILPGHVSTIIGVTPYGFLASEFKIPCVIAGFEAVDILQAVYMLLLQISEGRAEIENQYSSVVKPDGNPRALSLMNEVFVASDTDWRGIGIIPSSGLALKDEYRDYDALTEFPSLTDGVFTKKQRNRGCRCGDVMRGLITPDECGLFGRACTPEHPAGACMVSAEGSCAAYYKYGGLNI